MVRTLLIFLIILSRLNLHSQSCADTVFKVLYYSSDSIYATNHIVTSDDGSLIIGETRNYPFKKGLLLKLNRQGNIVWCKQLQGAAKLDLSKVIQLSDGTFAIAGVAVQPGYIHAAYIAKMNGSGYLLWQKFYTLNNNGNLNNIHVYNISEGNAGELIISWARGGINFYVGDDHSSSILMRLTATGSIVWSKYLIADQSNLPGIFYINGKIAILGQAYDATSSCPISGSGGLFTAMWLNYNSGEIEVQKNYCFLEIPNNVSQVESPDNHYSSVKMKNGNLALFGVFYQRDANSYHYKVIFDQNLEPISSGLYVTPYFGVNSSSSFTTQVLPSGITAISMLDNKTNRAYYGLVDEFENVVTQKTVPFSSDIVPIDGIYNSVFNSYRWSFRENRERISFVKNHTASNRQNIELTSMHQQGDTIACLGTNASFITKLPFTITPTAWNWTNISSNRIITNLADFLLAPYALNQQSECMFVKGPAIDLGNDISICAGDSIVISANDGFLNYSWQPSVYSPVSDRAIKISPSTETLYIVEATTIDGCIASDTVKVGIHSLPMAFIFNDTAICSDEKVLIKPFSQFNEYLWSTGSVNSSITVDRPGNYWLRVVDQNGCEGKEDFVIQYKECPSYIYFPTAFTPNKDGKNDVFKPIASRPLHFFKFEVYSRWGQKVFSTKDIQKGWDGNVNGSLQKTGTFVWQCEYQLPNETKRQVKGAVMLIR